MYGGVAGETGDPFPYADCILGYLLRPDESVSLVLGAGAAVDGV
jgi:hypothetical protein